MHWIFQTNLAYVPWHSCQCLTPLAITPTSWEASVSGNGEFMSKFNVLKNFCTRGFSNYLNNAITSILLRESHTSSFAKSVCQQDGTGILWNEQEFSSTLGFEN